MGTTHGSCRRAGVVDGTIIAILQWAHSKVEFRQGKQAHGAKPYDAKEPTPWDDSASTWSSPITTTWLWSGAAYWPTIRCAAKRFPAWWTAARPCSYCRKALWKNLVCRWGTRFASVMQMGVPPGASR